MAQYPDTNKSLIEKVRNGENISWNEFYTQYEPIICSLGEATGLSEADCKDLVQCVMIKFFQYSKSFKFEPGISRFRTYFHTIVRSQIADIIAQKQQENHSLGFMEDSEKSIDEKIESIFKLKWQEAVFKDMLKTLSNQVKEKTYLSFSMTAIDHVPIDEVANFLQISCDSIYVNRNRCINKLKTIVAQYKSEDPLLDLTEDFDV